MASRIIILLCVFAVYAGDTAARSKTDVVLIKNGDRITCEIKEITLNWNNEFRTDRNIFDTRVGWSLKASYSLFDYDTPETKIDIKLDAYPSTTEKGRYRIDFESKLLREIIKDFFFDLTYYLIFDSKTVSGEGEKKDYPISTSIGYSY
jgi:hypothetical protein